MIGCKTSKIVALAVRAKKCTKCSLANNKILRVILHTCPVNYVGSSGLIEAKVSLGLTTDIHSNSNGRVFFQSLFSADDSTIRSLLKHKDNNPKEQLDIKIPQPIFFVDPSHYIKLMSKPFFKMVTKTKDPMKCKTIDALRIKMFGLFYLQE